MRIRSLKIKHFKNLRSVEAEVHPSLNYIVGDNGMGKTNFLDGLYFCAFGRSYFTTTEQSALILDGEDYLRLRLELDEGVASHQLVVKMPLKGGRVIERDGVVVDRMARHVGFLPVVFITPDDGYILLSGSAERRRWMDRALSMRETGYLQALKNYGKLLKQRNALLKTAPLGRDISALLQTYDAQMGEPGGLLFHSRKQFVQLLNPLVEEYYRNISGGRESVAVEYRSQLEEGPLAELSPLAYPKDIHYRRTTVGPHKDDLTFTISGKALKRFASQGQLKSFVLALKLAEYHFLLTHTGKAPVLLVDDIFAKLDRARVLALLRFIQDRISGQVFITDTDPDRMQQLLRGGDWPHAAFKMNEGHLESLKIN